MNSFESNSKINHCKIKKCRNRYCDTTKKHPQNNHIIINNPMQHVKFNIIDQLVKGQKKYQDAPEHRTDRQLLNSSDLAL